MHSLETIPKGPSRFEICTSSLVLFLALGVFCLLLEREGVEPEIRSRATEALKSAPLQWYAIDVDGQEIRISGVVNTPADAGVISQRIGSIEGAILGELAVESVTDSGLCQGRLDVFAQKTQIAFLPGSAELEAGSEAGISRMAAVIRHCAPRIEVGVHTSARGDTSLNQQLSERRAAILVRGLVRAGVVADQLIARGYGETQPMVDETSGSAEVANDRVSFRVRGKAV